MEQTVLLYEDNDLLRESISAMIALEERFQMVGAFGDAIHAEQQVAELKPDLILMDIDMPGRSGIEAVKQIRATGVTAPILMLTVFDDSQHVFDALCAGASGYLLKKHLAQKLFDSLDEINKGGAPMSPTIAQMVIRSFQKQTKTNPYQLTTRESEVLASLAQGNSYKMIASRYAITIDTVRAHIKKIYEKLQVHSQTEAVSKALKEKLV